MTTREEFFKQTGIDLSRQIDVPAFTTADKYQPIPSDKQKEISDKRAELEMRKLEIEIEKLEKPTTSIDYFQQMLSMQQQHFNQLLEMQKSQSNLMIEIEKLKLGGEGGESDDSMFMLLDMIKPILPQLLAKKDIKIPSTEGQGDKKTMNREEYLAKMRNGEITPQMGWEDFKLEFPELASKMTYEQFTIQFEKVKKEGIPEALK